MFQSVISAYQMDIKIIHTFFGSHEPIFLHQYFKRQKGKSILYLNDTQESIIKTPEKTGMAIKKMAVISLSINFN